MLTLYRDDLEKYSKDNIDFLGLDLAVISSLFIAKIQYFQVNRILDTHEIMHEVKYLEDVTNYLKTKKYEKFKGLFLKGLYKKHS